MTYTEDEIRNAVPDLAREIVARIQANRAIKEETFTLEELTAALSKHTTFGRYQNVTLKDIYVSSLGIRSLARDLACTMLAARKDI